MFVEKILEKVGSNGVLNVPIRRVGLTGSGMNNQCHGNVCNLVHRYGGQRLFGYIKNPIQAYENYLHCISHSVWLTPEGNLADVTAHNYSKDVTFQEFYPLGYEKKYTVALLDFLIPQNPKLHEIYINFRDATDFYSVFYNLKKVEIGNITFLILKNKLINFDNLSLTFPEQSGELWKQVLSCGGFSKKSTATNEYWSAITVQGSE